MADTSKHIDQMNARIEKLSLGPNDLIVVRDEADMSTFYTPGQKGYTDYPTLAGH